MKWFKHYTDASNDDAINRLEQEHGYEGYGVYWKLLELCAAKYDGKNEAIFIFNRSKMRSTLRLSYKRLESIFNLGSKCFLFTFKTENENYIFEFPKLAEIKDNHTKNLQVTGKSLASNLPLDKNKNKNKNKNIYKLENQVPLHEVRPPELVEVLSNNDEQIVLTMLNSICFKNFRPVENNLKLIRRLLKAGFTLEDFKTVIKFKQEQWGADQKFSQYLRPETIFGNKFESYLEAARNKPKTWEEGMVDLLTSGVENNYPWASGEAGGTK